MTEKLTDIIALKAKELQAKQSLLANFQYWTQRREAISGPNPSDGRFMEMSVLDEKIRKNLPELLAKYERYEKAAQFYADRTNWTTNDDESHFIKVADADWEKGETGFAGGKTAREALTK